VSDSTFGLVTPTLIAKKEAEGYVSYASSARESKLGEKSLSVEFAESDVKGAVDAVARVSGCVGWFSALDTPFLKAQTAIAPSRNIASGTWFTPIKTKLATPTSDIARRRSQWIAFSLLFDVIGFSGLHFRRPDV
jgi:hypothetical protein